MDKIVEGFLRKVGHLIEYNAQISAIKATSAGVTVTWMRGPVPVVELADYCASNIPCPILARLDTDFPDDKEKRDGVTFWDAVTGPPLSRPARWAGRPIPVSGKTTRTRLWRNLLTDDVIEQIWYPSKTTSPRKVR